MKYLAVDSNTLTYLLDSVQESYDPRLDPTELRTERVAMLRCYFYGGCSFWVPPTVQAEYQKISDAGKRRAHDRWTKCLLQDMPLKTTAGLDSRTAELLAHHRKAADCRVVAETEASGLKALLSCDLDLIIRLGPQAKVQVMRPTQFWKSLPIEVGAMPVVQPADGNPLASVTWWRLESGVDA